MKILYFSRAWAFNNPKCKDNPWAFPAMMYEARTSFVWEDVNRRTREFDKYKRHEVIVAIVTDDTSETIFYHELREKLLCSFTLQPGYDCCCGLREFGSFDIRRQSHVKIKDIITLLQKEFKENCAAMYNVGALTYTEVKSPSGTLVYEDASELVNAWPGGSVGEWWYNPNSGNYVRIWTLPINQHRANNPDEDEDLYEEDEE